MMTFDKIVEGINIIAKHNKDEYCIQTGHDQLWVGSIDLPLTDAEKARMLEMGWFRSEDAWSCFV